MTQNSQTITVRNLFNTGHGEILRLKSEHKPIIISKPSVTAIVSSHTATIANPFENTAILQDDAEEIFDSIDNDEGHEVDARLSMKQAMIVRDAFDEHCADEAAEQLEDTFEDRRRKCVSSSSSVPHILQCAAVPRKRRIHDAGGHGIPDEASESLCESDTPGRAPGSASVAMEEVADMRVPVYSPFWAYLMLEYGEALSPKNCLGCCRGTLGNPRLFDRLLKMFLEHLMKYLISGIEKALIWAGPYFRKIIMEFIGTEIPESELPLWEGWCRSMPAVYHCARHENSKQMRQIFETIELQWYIDKVKDNELCTRGVLDPPSVFRVEKPIADKLIKLKMLQTKIEEADPKKSCTYHQLLSIGASTRSDLNSFFNFSGRNASSIQP